MDKLDQEVKDLKAVIKSMSKEERSHFLAMCFSSMRDYNDKYVDWLFVADDFRNKVYNDSKGPGCFNRGIAANKALIDLFILIDE